MSVGSLPYSNANFAAIREARNESPPAFDRCKVAPVSDRASES